MENKLVTVHPRDLREAEDLQDFLQSRIDAENRDGWSVRQMSTDLAMGGITLLLERDDKSPYRVEFKNRARSIS